MNWSRIRSIPWVDTRARFVSRTPRGGALLDLGSSDGQTLNHMAELRPDLKLFAVDLAGNPAVYPKGCRFQRANLERDRLLWPDASMDAVTCMHLVEHLGGLENLLREAERLLKPGGRLYVETPHPRTVHLKTAKGAGPGKFTVNFFDDPTHVRVVTTDDLRKRIGSITSLQVLASGISRNWLFAAAWPLYWFRGSGPQKFTSYVHWIGWSAYLIAAKRL